MSTLLGAPIGDSTQVDVQRFGPDFNNGTRVGSNLWVRPTLFTPRFMTVHICGSAGGGGAGRKQALTSNAAGGAGGCAGELISYSLLDPLAIPDRVVVTIAAGGAGGASQTTNSTNGVVGIAGGISTFGPYVSARGGVAQAAQASTSTVAGNVIGASVNAQGSAGSGGSGTLDTVGGSPTMTTVAVGSHGVMYPQGGGGGAGFTGSSTGNNGGDGKATLINIFGPLPATRGGVAGGALDGLEGVSLCPATLIPYYTGGGGGASDASGNAGTGGAGHFGSGGGGGGAARNSVGNSGAGGKGGDGFCVVVVMG